MYDVVNLKTGVVVEECFTVDWAALVARCHSHPVRGVCVVVRDGEVL